MNQHFFLPSEDREFLDEIHGQKWETVSEGGIHWLFIQEYPVPAGYNHNLVTLALLINPMYPDVQIDMAYCFPALCLNNGRVIPNILQQQINGKQFQGWSRHRTSENPWRPGIDDIAGHLTLVQHWFERELTR
jgi:hypothetical protein